MECAWKHSRDSTDNIKEHNTSFKEGSASYLTCLIPPQHQTSCCGQNLPKVLRCVSEEWLIGGIMCVLRRTLDSLHTQLVNLSILFLMLFVALVTVIHKCSGTVQCGCFRVQPAVVGLVDSRGGELVIAQHCTTQVNNSTFKDENLFLNFQIPDCWLLREHEKSHFLHFLSKQSYQNHIS